MIALGGTSEVRESCDQTKSMIALGGQRFVGVSQVDETRGERPSSAGRAVRTKRVNHAIKLG
jgi:hypothetical protein